VLPYTRRKVGVVVTGDRLVSGLEPDKFTPLMRMKVGALGGEIIHTILVPDDEKLIADALTDMRERGAEMICICGSLSINPDHVTLDGIRRCGASILACGAPVMPGSMCVVAYLAEVPILGVPSCSLRNKATAVEALLPHMLAGNTITRENIAALGHGGMCLNCQTCNYPCCPFCK